MGPPQPLAPYRMLYVIQNDPTVPPGIILDPLPVPYAMVHPYLGEELPGPDDVSALIVLGGSMGANDDSAHPFLTALKELIRRAVARDIPYLGICLGGQLLAGAMGARVASGRWGEFGTQAVDLTDHGKTDPLFEGIPREFHSFQWHHDSFDIPDGGIRLASSRACSNQAFRIGRRAWGLQFHPEVTEPIVRDWAEGDPSTAPDAEDMIVEFSKHSPAYHATARQLIGNFTRLAEI